MASAEKIKQVLNDLLHLANAPEVTFELIKGYHEVLGQWDDQVLDAAVLHYKSTETFFPTEGALNLKVLDLHMIALGVPTAGEAWSQVLGAIRFVESVLCFEGDMKRKNIDGKSGGEYMAAIFTYGKHKDECQICVQGGYQEIYGHPAVKATVEFLGGRDRLFTDNPAADRKQFVDAYRERVQLEGRKAIMPPKVRDHIQSTQAIEAGNQIKQLTGRMEK